MFLRRHRRKKNGETYDYWTLVESVRTARGPRQRTVANRRIGRLFQRFSRTAHLYDVTIGETPDPDHKSGMRLTVTIEVRDDLREWVEQADGCYLLRTNLENHDAQALWKTHIGLTQIEDCFRIAKHDMGLRPIRLRTVSRPEKHLAILLQQLGLPLPNKPKKIQNAVQTFAEKIDKSRQMDKPTL